MFNAVLVSMNGRKLAYFNSIDAADMYISLMRRYFDHLDLVFTSDWVYIDGLVF